MTLYVTLNTSLSSTNRSYEDIEVTAGPNNSIPQIVEQAARKVGISPSIVSSFVITGTTEK